MYVYVSRDRIVILIVKHFLGTQSDEAKVLMIIAFVYHCQLAHFSRVISNSPRKSSRVSIVQSCKRERKGKGKSLISR